MHRQQVVDVEVEIIGISLLCCVAARGACSGIHQVVCISQSLMLSQPDTNTGRTNDHGTELAVA
jgi:hypothetical protein